MCRSAFIVRGSGEDGRCGICSQCSFLFLGAVSSNGLHRAYLDLALEWFDFSLFFMVRIRA